MLDILSPVFASLGGDATRPALLALPPGNKAEFIQEVLTSAGTQMQLVAGLDPSSNLLQHLVERFLQVDYDADPAVDLVISNGLAWNFFDYASGSSTGAVWTGVNGTTIRPAPMDFDGDGKMDLATYADGAWHFFSLDGTYFQGVWTGGVAGDLTVPANFRGDRTEEPVIFRGGAWLFYTLGGMPVAYHAYFPFGEEVTSTTQDAERLKFTGHERDLGNMASAADDLDYMHARHASALTGRFLSTDPVESGNPGTPQTWNKYTYAVDNPLKYVDPDGQAALLLIWGAVEAGLSVADAIDTGRTLASDVAVEKKVEAATYFGAGLIGPGAFYSRADDAAGLLRRGATSALDDVAEAAFRAANSKTLAKNLAEAGVERGAGSAAHHIVAGRSRYAEEGRRILGKFGIDINSSANGRVSSGQEMEPCPWRVSPDAAHSGILQTGQRDATRGQD